MEDLAKKYEKLLADSTKAFAFLATIMEDGAPQVTPIWFDFDGEYIRFNSARGRVKDENIRRNPEVAIAIVDPGEMYNYLQVRGAVEVITEAGAREHIDTLSLKYRGREYTLPSEDQVRVMYKIKLQ
jgi:PPOX class probable F420-dependent enzyme